MENSTKYNKIQGILNSIKSAMPKHCSNCGAKYEASDFSLIQNDDFSALLHLTCSKCKESYLINVLSPLGTLNASSRIPLKVDIISADEAKKFIGNEAISTDDILNAHVLLKKIKSAEDLESSLLDSTITSSK